METNNNMLIELYVYLNENKIKKIKLFIIISWSSNNCKICIKISLFDI